MLLNVSRVSLLMRYSSSSFVGDVVVERRLMNIQTGGDLARSGFAESLFTEQDCGRIEHQFRRWAGQFGRVRDPRRRFWRGNAAMSPTVTIRLAAPRGWACRGRVLHAAQRKPCMLANENFRTGWHRPFEWRRRIASCRGSPAQ